jgi:nucleotide-binding universal stress UspA family protein
MYKRILLAYNGTAEGRAALLACAELAAFIKAETHLLSVASLPTSMFLTEGFLPEEVIEEEKKRMQRILDEGVADMTAQGFAVTGHLAVGEPVEEIAGVADRLACDLIVVGHKQKQSFATRWWSGSVGASLLDYAPCSILVAVTK